MSAKTPPNQSPKSKIRNPKSKIQNPKFAREELLHKAPKSKIRNPKSKIQNPKSKIQNSGNLGRWGPHVKECYITIQNPKSKIPEIRPNRVWILDFGLENFGFRILDFGGSGGCTTRQFSDGALGSEARIPPGPSLGGGAEPTVSDTVGEREGTWWWKQQEKQVKPIFYVQVWAIYVRWSVFGGQSEGNQNQLYLVQLGEEGKLGNRNERRREGKRWATLPPTVSDTVGFGYL